MDFVDKLPKSEGYGNILVLIRQVDEVCPFPSLLHPLTAQVIMVFLNNMCRLHGISISIVTDRNRIFTSLLWQKLFTLLR